MPGIHVAKVVKKVNSVNKIAAMPAGIHKEWNGKGGFKPGNKYGSRADRSQLAAHLHSARK